MKENNYVVLQSFMIDELKLKGTELIIYAIINGFSQADEQKYSGSLQYLSEWTGTTKRNVINCLNSLVSRGLIAKEEVNVRGVKLCNYNVVQDFTTGEKISPPGEKSSPNNIIKNYMNNPVYDDNKKSNINNYNKDFNEDLLKEKEQKEKITEIVEYLNAKIGSHYKPGTKETGRHIRARLSEGYSVEDFKKVIDKKCSSWMGDEKMCKFLRPETLFGTKFESYLNEPDAPSAPKGESWKDFDITDPNNYKDVRW